MELTYFFRIPVIGFLNPFYKSCFTNPTNRILVANRGLAFLLRTLEEGNPALISASHWKAAIIANQNPPSIPVESILRAVAQGYGSILAMALQGCVTKTRAIPHYRRSRNSPLYKPY